MAQNTVSHSFATYQIPAEIWLQIVGDDARVFNLLVRAIPAVRRAVDSAVLRARFEGVADMVVTNLRQGIKVPALCGQVHTLGPWRIVNESYQIKINANYGRLVGNGYEPSFVYMTGFHIHEPCIAHVSKYVEISPPDTSGHPRLRYHQYTSDGISFLQAGKRYMDGGMCVKYLSIANFSAKFVNIDISTRSVTYSQYTSTRHYCPKYDDDIDDILNHFGATQTNETKKTLFKYTTAIVDKCLYECVAHFDNIHAVSMAISALCRTLAVEADGGMNAMCLL